MALIYGKPNTTVNGTNKADEIHLNGKADAYGKAGDDTIFGSAAANKIYGQDDNDTIYTGGGNDSVWGGRGEDVITAESTTGSVKLYGESGNDWLTGGNGNDTLDGGADNDALWGGGGSNKLYGRDGDDFISASGKDSAWGGRGNDTIGAYGNQNPVKLYGEGGNDWMFGGNGTDFLDGGAGNDFLIGEMSDTLRGGTGDDRFSYSSFLTFTDEVTQASKGIISGGAGHDILQFGVGLEHSVPHIEVRMTGESAGTATIDGLPKLTFTGINEIIDLSDGFETNARLIYHGENADTDMKVTGGDVGNTFFGGAGNETFRSGAGDDIYVFVFKEGTMGYDTINNFGQNPGQMDPSGPGFDTIYFAGAEGKLTTVQTEFHAGPTPEQPAGWDATRYESYYADGRLAHVLEVDAIGLPPIGTYDDLIG